jgi:1L-myo-inositol 1-phosphate cytidylyltransferase / CDP-L-myo-inositol myo-inositolphosphotransferase
MEIANKPTLVLLLDASNAPASSGEQSILGLTLIERAALAGHRAGYGAIFLLARDRAAPAGVKAIADWNEVAARLSSRAATLVIAPATILAEPEWLTRVARMRIAPATWAAIPGRIAVLAPIVVPDALSLLQPDGAASDMTAVEARLGRRLGPAAAMPSGIDPLIAARPQDIPAAERRLLDGLVKDTDGFMARHVDRRISLQITRHLASSAITPTQVTIISMVIGLLGAPFFLSAHWYWQTLGALLLLLHSIVDGCDGELARLKFQESKYGGLLDFWGDNIVHVAIFACLAVGWASASAATWPLWAGAAAIIGTLGSAGLVYWNQLRGKEGPGPLFTSVSGVRDDRLSRMLDAASRRDFVYGLPILALFGQANWFLLLAAVGAPIFFVLLIVLALRECIQSKALRSAT